MSNIKIPKSHPLAAGSGIGYEASRSNYGSSQDKIPVDSDTNTSTDTDTETEDGDEDVDRDDAISETSTVCYEHEPLDTFQNKVAELVAKHFKKGIAEIDIQRMKGGSFNRVVGVNVLAKPKDAFRNCFKLLFLSLRTLFQSKSRDKQSYVVRIPRGDCSIESDIAILRAVHSLLPLPTPEVVAYDLSADNVFESPYMIQKRLPGQNMTQLWKSMNIEQKKNAAKDIINLVRLIASVEAPPGKLSSKYLSEEIFDTVCVDKFDIGQANEDRSPGQQALSHTVPHKPIELLLDQCERWRQEQKSEGVCFYKVWNAFGAISKSLEARGFLNGACVLVHGDLKIYNLLAEIRNSAKVEITGVIDWDGAIVAPEFMAYRAPFWLWNAEDIDSAVAEDECNAIMEPQTEEGRALKAVFVEYASEKYKRFAFAPEAMLARRMFKILQNGIFGPWDMTETEEIISAWDELHPDDGILERDEDEDKDEDNNSERGLWAASLD